MAMSSKQTCKTIWEALRFSPSQKSFILFFPKTLNLTCLLLKVIDPKLLSQPHCCHHQFCLFHHNLLLYCLQLLTLFNTEECHHILDGVQAWLKFKTPCHSSWPWCLSGNSPSTSTTIWGCNATGDHEALDQNCTALLADLKEKCKKPINMSWKVTHWSSGNAFCQSRSCETDGHFIKHQFLYMLECPTSLLGCDQPPSHSGPLSQTYYWLVIPPKEDTGTYISLKCLIIITLTFWETHF